MVMVHFGPNPVPETRAGSLYEISHGRASILFVLLAGVGISLLARSSSGSSASMTIAQILSRAALLLPLGLWLQTLDHGVLVILHYYAMYFIFSCTVILLPSRALLSLGVGVLFAGPAAYHYTRARWPDWFSGDPAQLGDPWGEIARDLVLTGYYPLVTWAAPLVIGIWIGRHHLTSTSRLRLIIVGALLAFGSSIGAMSTGGVLADSSLITLSTEPHSQSHLWLIGSTGSAIAVLGVSLVIADSAKSLVWPLVAAGQLALTIYTGHLLLLHEFSDVLRYDTVDSAALSVAVFMSLVVIVSTIWRRSFSHGPLETVLRLPALVLRAIQNR